MNEKVSLTYSEVFKTFLGRCNHEEENQNVDNQLSKEVKSLQFVKTCLSIGTGFGANDITFIKCCLPNLEKLIVVEKDSSCLRELKVNMKNAFGDKIEIEYHEARIEDFMNENRNLSSKVDLILALYVLYFLTPESRKDLFKMCFDQWLEPDKGMLIVSNPSKNNDFITAYNMAAEKMDSFQDAEMLKNEIIDLNLDIINEKTYNFTIDLGRYDTDIYGMMVAFNCGISEEKIRVALKEVCSDGEGKAVCQIYVVQKKNPLLLKD